MAIDTFMVFVGVYSDVETAKADYATIKELHRKSGMIDAYDAAVLQKQENGKVKIVAKHETPTRVGGILGGGLGLASGVAVALFPFAALGAGLLAATTAGGVALGALAGHAAAGMSRSDLKDLGEHLDSGEAGLIVVGVADMRSRIEQEMRQAEKIEVKELDADLAELERDATEATEAAKTSADG